jgi:hypothetical protein
MKVHQAIGGNLVAHADCHGVTPGGTDLLDGGEVKRLRLTAEEKLAIWKDIQKQFGSPWSYRPGASLGGNLYVRLYKAYDEHKGSKCWHGAEFKAQHDVSPPSGRQLEWLQVYKESGGAESDPYTYTVDPPPGAWIDENENGEVDPGETMDDAPFYYNKDENPGYFYDRPGSAHPEAQPWSGSVTFYLFLASWDGDFNPGTYPHTITVHDGFKWGFDGYCTPEPASLVVLVLGPLVWSRRRVG